MILRRLLVEHFRCYNLPLEIEFDERFTIVAGLNEIGKSTLFDALRYALFRRSGAGGRDIERLEPWGTTGLSPSVTIDFEYDGTDYQLRKCWGPKAGTQVSRRAGDGSFVTFKVNGADEFIASMFAGQPQKHGAFPGFTGQNIGLAYLLFAPQGAMPIAGERKEIELNPDARARLTQIVGAAAQTADAARIAKKVVADYALCFTATGKRKKHSRADDAHVKLTDADSEIASLEEVITRYAEVADALEDSQTQLASVLSAASTAQAELKELRPRMQRAVSAQAEFNRAEAAYQVAKTAYETLIGKEQRREYLETQLKQLEPTLSALQGSEKAARQAYFIAAEKRNAASEALAIADRDRGTRELQSELDAAISADAHHRERINLRSRVARVQSIGQLLRGVEPQLDSAKPATTSDVTTLQALCEQERELQVRLEASQTIVSIEPLHDLQVTWSQNNAKEVENVAARTRVTRDVDGFLTVSMDGIGQVEIRGPSGDAAMLSAQLSQVKSELSRLEERVGTRNALELQKSINAKWQADEEYKRLTKELADVLDGSTAEEIGANLQRLGPDAPVPSTAQRVEELRAELNQQNAAFEMLRQGTVDAMRASTEGETVASKAAAEAQNRLRTFENETIWPVRAELEEFARAGKSETERKFELNEAYAARHEAEHLRDKAQAGYRRFALALDPAAELAEKEHTAERLAQDVTEADFRVREYQSELRRISEQEPGSRLVELYEKRERLSADFEEQERSEQAVRLLHDFVLEADARRVASFAGPILARVRPWFERATGRSVEALQLSANSEMNELRISGVPRAVDFEELSQGAGDQLALFIRLAFASLLTADDCLGRMPVLLDDPLVNADWERRPRMIEIFTEVADTAQIIVFTCRPEDYAKTPARTVMLNGGTDTKSGLSPFAVV